MSALVVGDHHVMAIRAAQIGATTWEATLTLSGTRAGIHHVTAYGQTWAEAVDCALLALAERDAGE